MAKIPIREPKSLSDFRNGALFYDLDNKNLYIRNNNLLTAITEQLPEGIINVKDFGATGNGTTDDTIAIQNAVDNLQDGQILYFPPGEYLISSTININKFNVKLIGTLNTNIQSGTSIDNTLSSKLIYTGENCLFKITTSPNTRGIKFIGLTLKGPGTSTGVYGILFEIDTFGRDYLIQYCSIQNFEIAIAISKLSTERGIAKLNILNCNIMHNKRILVNLNDTQINNGCFCFNEAGQNGYTSLLETFDGVIDIKGNSFIILNNILEGQANPIKIQPYSSSIEIKNNYFEANVGKYLIYMSLVSISTIENNHTLTVNTENEIAYLIEKSNNITIRNSRGLIAIKRSNYNLQFDKIMNKITVYDNTPYSSVALLIYPLSKIPESNITYIKKYAEKYSVNQDSYINSEHLSYYATRQTGDRTLFTISDTIEPNESISITHLLHITKNDPSNPGTQDLYPYVYFDDHVNNVTSSDFSFSNPPTEGTYLIILLMTNYSASNISSITYYFYPYGPTNDDSQAYFLSYINYAISDIPSIIFNREIFNKIQSGTSRPSKPYEGMLFYDTNISKLILYDGTQWVDTSGTAV